MHQQKKYEIFHCMLDRCMQNEKKKDCAFFVFLLVFRNERLIVSHVMKRKDRTMFTHKCAADQ